MSASRKLLSVHVSDGVPQRRPIDCLEGWDVLLARNLAEARNAIRHADFRIGLLSMEGMPVPDIAEIEAFLREHPTIAWVGAVAPEVAQHPAVQELIAEHLVDFHTLPLDAERVRQMLGHLHGMCMLRDRVKHAVPPSADTSLVGHGPAMTHLLRKIAKVAKVDAPVLIRGESGSGKELTAQAIHRHSSRQGRPFVPVNCGAIPASLIQSELFGYERGAFTGAAQRKQGMFESAAGGTLFLDEIADLSLDLQTNLLRFLQEKTINRVGSTQSMQIDVRIIAATHADLEAAVARGVFREDLFYRLNVLPLTMPALRDRKEDIPSLAQHFFERFCTEKNPRLLGFSRRAIHALSAHPWPGNVRELINRIRMAMVMAEGRFITVDDLGLQPVSVGAHAEALGEIRVTAERKAILYSLHRTQKNVTQAARDLGVSRMTLYRLMAKLDIRV